jgi:signal transduction histidine kinase
VLYAAAFLAAGALLVVLTYFLVSQSLTTPGFDRLDSLRARPSTGVDAEAIRDALEAFRADTLNDLLTWSIAALAGALVLATGLGWLLAGRALRPLEQITATARRVADRSLHERIALVGPDDELKELADTFDDMLERLDRSFDAQRRFVGNASHELRTPLAVNRTVIEVAAGADDASDDLKRLAPTLLATNERSERLVEGLLTLAGSDHAVSDTTPVDLAELAAAATELSRREAEATGQDVSADLHAAQVAGNVVLLERLVVNLVDNAVRHSGPDASVTVRTGRWNDHAVLQVENTGPQLQNYEIEGLFEPFRRGNGRAADGRGIGLGLSIVRSVAHAHGGAVFAHARDGGGMVVRIELPARR